MNDLRVPSRPAPVRALDDNAARLIRPGERERLDDATVRFHEAPTEPERSTRDASVLELRTRAGERLWLPRAEVDDVLQQSEGGARPGAVPAPIDSRRDLPTMPETSARSASDVFQSLVPEHPTPLDRPPRFGGRSTELDPRQAAPTATYHAARDMPVADEGRAEPRRDRDALGTTRERALVQAMYDSERRFVVVESEEPSRAEHIRSLATALKTSDVFSRRERVLAIHLRQRFDLEDVPAEHKKKTEDQALAVALVARELDDKYRDTMRALRDQLVERLPTLPEKKREAVFADFDSFMQDGGGEDSHYCRRELDDALNNEVVLHRAYVYALALAPADARQRAESEAAAAGEKRKAGK